MARGNSTDGGAETTRRLAGMVRSVGSVIGGFSGSTANVSDPTGHHIAGLRSSLPLITGTVIRSGIGSYDCEVDVGGGSYPLVCSCLAPILSDMYGASQACMPVAGSCVLVYAPEVGLSRKRAVHGIILGVVPGNGMPLAPEEGGLKKLADSDVVEGGVAQYTENGPASIASDKRNPYKGEFQCGRPHDIVPGEYGVLNHAGCGMVIGALSTTIKGSEAASVRCSALDDQVRVISGHFRHISSAGSEEIFNDGGYVSTESFVTMYQSERLGVATPSDTAFEKVSGDVRQLKDTRSPLQQRKPTQTAKKRLYRYSGYLGDIETVFVASPDPSKTVEDMESESLDSGLYHSHVDASGRLCIRSAGGIMFERYDRIPVPKRRKYAWDPTGSKASESEPAEKKPYVVPDEFPMGAGPSLGDMAAWWNDLSYARFRQFGADFTIPGQDELPCPQDGYDEIGRGSEQFGKYDKKHSYVSLTPDGGIVLRDAWGSEIVMADGRITFNAASNIEIRSGRSVVVLGGDDVVAKAYNSVDITATKKDVCIKAENNLQAVAVNRSVLIQSKAAYDSPPDWSKTGEDRDGGGIILKADKSTVTLVGSRASLQGLNGVSVASFSEDGDPSGVVAVAGKQVVVSSTDRTVCTSGSESGVSIRPSGATICAPAVLTAASGSNVSGQGEKVLLGIPVDSEADMYAAAVRECKAVSEQYTDSEAWISPVLPSTFSSIDFSFRTTEQYACDRDSGISGGTFKVYQPSWVAMANAPRPPMNGIQVREWDEGYDAFGECPWPGSKAMRGMHYVTYVESNFSGSGVESVGTGEAASCAQLTTEPFSSYHIRA